MCTSILFLSCSSNKSSNQNSASNSTTGNKTFTAEELKKYNGENGNPAYVAVNGIVYDVTNARKWKNGKHENGVVAGVDLTNSIGQSPHGASVLKDLPVVGTLK
ncbi:cytochrome B5 [Clostridium sp. 19966]|nr:cytochrome B5 [Clostridium sp. 19966]